MAKDLTTLDHNGVGSHAQAYNALTAQASLKNLFILFGVPINMCEKHICV